jgi:lysophospholipase L1-like esterase
VLLVVPTVCRGQRTVDRVRDERSLAYRYDSELGWFPKAEDEVSYTGTRTIHIAHNAMGFRDKDHPLEKKRPRIVFVGDSFVWGYDVEVGERFTEILQAELDSIDVLNLGVSGYGTDQCYLLLEKFFDRYDPDAVVYMFSATDVFDNSVNFNYKAYFKPYYVLKDGRLELRGVPVPRASVWTTVLKTIADRFPRLRNRADVTPHLISAMESFVKSRGASFAVGLIDESKDLRRHFDQEGIVFFDLTHVDERYRYPEHGSHWTPEGHRLVARAVLSFLLHNSATGEERGEAEVDTNNGANGEPGP